MTPAAGVALFGLGCAALSALWGYGVGYAEGRRAGRQQIVRERDAARAEAAGWRKVALSAQPYVEDAYRLHRLDKLTWPETFGGER